MVLTRSGRSLAILGHDVARAAKKSEILRQAGRFEMPVLDIERRAPVTLHGPVGAELLRHDDGLEDEDILAAVRFHTTGSADMTPLGLLVFIADKLEPRKIKSYPYQQELRHIANESLSQAVLEFLCRESALRLQTEKAGPPSQHPSDKLAAFEGCTGQDRNPTTDLKEVS